MAGWWGEHSLLWVFQLKDTDFLQWKQSYKLPVHFTLFVSIRFAESSLEPESACVFSACITRSLRSCISWPVFFPGGCKGPLWVVWHEAWPAADLHKHLRSGQGIVRRRAGLLSWSAESLGLGSEHLQTEESAWGARVHLPTGEDDPKQTFHRGHTWEERPPASFLCWVLS